MSLSPAVVVSKPELAEVVVVVEVVVTSSPTVTLSVDAAVVVIPLSAAIVSVSPSDIVWEVPEVPAKVKDAIPLEPVVSQSAHDPFL